MKIKNDIPLAFFTTKEGRKTLEINHRVIFDDCLNMLNYLEENSIDLIKTSPPYWNIIDYGNVNQIGFHDSLEEYLDKLMDVFEKSVKVLKPNRKLVINIGDKFVSKENSEDGNYQIIPLSSLIISRLFALPNLIYIGKIDWKKVSKSETSGGGKVMGSFKKEGYAPRNGYFFTNREFIMIFKKIDKDYKEPIDPIDLKNASLLSKEVWKPLFKDEWKITPERMIGHSAMYPLEVPLRIIKMYSIIGDHVLDPFLGSGTTTLACSVLGRHSVGFEIGFQTNNEQDWKTLIKSKITKNYVDTYSSDNLLIHNNYTFE